MAVDVVADLFERDAELAELDALVDAAVAGSGRLLWVEGPAGIGKTRLAGVARERGVARGLVVLRAQGGELERNAPWGIARELLAGVLLDAEPGERERLLTGVAAHARAPLAIQDLRGWNGETDLSAAVHGLYWLLASLADRQALLVAIDDAHWADPATLRLLAYLAPRLDELALSLLVAARPLAEAPDPDLLGRVMAEPEVRVCRPAALSEAGAAELLGRTFGRRPGAVLVAACRRATAGNPFLLRELAIELRAEGVDPTAEDVGRIDGLVPEAVARSVLLRLARLPEEAVSLARAAAVHGAPLTLARCAELAGLDVDETYAAADALVAASIMAADPL
jgi:predicted ATPase